MHTNGRQALHDLLVALFGFLKPTKSKSAHSKQAMLFEGVSDDTRQNIVFDLLEAFADEMENDVECNSFPL